MDNEDIKILEELIEIGLEDFTDITITDRQAQAVENLIARYKDLEKNYINPNKARISYFDKGKGTEVVIEGFIPKSKVQEKIEELEAMSISQDIYYDDIKRLFQELLEES